MPQGGLLSGAEGTCLASPERGVYAVYLLGGGEAKLEIAAPEGTAEKSPSYDVKWYDPRKGGDLQDGSVRQVQAVAGKSTQASLGKPPVDPDEDWAVLVRRRR
jgi:hypothetical protein